MKANRKNIAGAQKAIQNGVYFAGLSLGAGAYDWYYYAKVDLRRLAELNVGDDIPTCTGRLVYTGGRKCPLTLVSHLYKRFCS